LVPSSVSPLLTLRAVSDSSSKHGDDARSEEFLRALDVAATEWGTDLVGELQAQWNAETRLAVAAFLVDERFRIRFIRERLLTNVARPRPQWQRGSSLHRQQ